MLHILKYLFFIFTFFIFTIAQSIETDWSAGSESKVRLISGISNNNNQKEMYLGLEYQMEEGWKTYWKSPGEGGFPQTIDWSKSVNISNLKIKWPTPSHFEILGMKSIGYSDNVIFPIKLAFNDIYKSSKLVLDINYLVCKDICIPGNKHLELDIPAGKANLTKHFFNLEKAISNLPQKNLELSFIKNSQTKVYSNDQFIFIDFSATSKKIFDNPLIFLHTKYGLPVNDPVINLSIDSKKLDAKFTYNSDLINDKKIDTQIIISDNNESYISNEIINVKNKNPITNNDYIFIILIAFVGGLILNIMPCVLPILSIKLLSILNHANHESSIRKSFLVTSLGIVTSFFLLAGFFIIMRHLGYNVGWGMQFQQPTFLMFLALILTLFTLNLFGLFEFSLPNFVNSKKFLLLQNNKNTRDFFNGFFATLMATPCSAPFVGTALTFAFTQSSLALIFIFISMGIGMASPYITICFFPQMLKFLPKPGNWILYSKYFLGFLLLGTTLWVCNILLNHFNIYFMIISFALVITVLYINFYYRFKKLFTLFAILIFFYFTKLLFFFLNI